MLREDDNRANAKKPDAPAGNPAEQRPELEAGASLNKENRRVVLFALCVVAFLLMAHFSPLEAMRVAHNALVLALRR